MSEHATDGRTESEVPPRTGLALRPFRALRPAADGDRLARLLCPPYDVIDEAERARLAELDADNAVTVILPEPEGELDRYRAAAATLERWVADGHCRVDAEPALYVYEMRDRSGASTRGLIGAVELRDPAEGVILPHENTMAGPVADRLALMASTEANLEPIYLVYDGGGAASAVVHDASAQTPIAEATTADGITHRLWSRPESEVHAAVAADLAGRRALIADGHHRYATYRELQQRLRAARGEGPWDRGLTLLVDSSSYGPQVHAIHRVLRSLPLDEAIAGAGRWGLTVVEQSGVTDALAEAEQRHGFAVVLADARRAVLLCDPDERLKEAARAPGQPEALGELDVTAVHRGLVEQAWQLPDDVETVGYAHTVDEALGAVGDTGTAVLLRATPVAAVAAVAAAGARMPRKSTLFTPKPASGLVMRRFADER